MPKTRRLSVRVLIWIIAGLIATTSALAQAPPGESREKIDQDYLARIRLLEGERIARLAKLAAAQSPADAELTYLEIFQFAVSTDQYVAAEAAAVHVIQHKPAGGELVGLAHLVNILAKADRGAFDESLADLKSYISVRAGGPRLPASDTLALAEAYFRRLTRGGRYDLAREVCDLALKNSGDPAVRDHFAAYRKRLDLVGKPAPTLAGKSSDGDPVSLEALRGKVVLVVFWATWCNPSSDALPALRQTLERLGPRGFTILGVNLDTGAERAKEVRGFIVENTVPFPSLLSGEGHPDLAAPFGVSEIPATYLIGKDGKVVGLDVSPADLESKVAAALRQDAVR